MYSNLIWLNNYHQASYYWLHILSGKQFMNIVERNRFAIRVQTVQLIYERIGPAFSSLYLTHHGTEVTKQTVELYIAKCIYKIKDLSVKKFYFSNIVNLGKVFQ